MKDLIRYLISLLVSNPESIEIDVQEGRRRTIYAVTVHPDDLGIVIGRSGRTINAIRTLVSAAASQDGERSWIRLVDEDDDADFDSVDEVEVLEDSADEVVDDDVEDGYGDDDYGDEDSDSEASSDEDSHTHDNA